MKILQDDSSERIWIGQPAYISKIFQKFGMQDCKPVSTPVDPGAKLTKSSNSEDCLDQQRYQSAIGALLYLSVSTRPDITYTVSTLAKFSSNPTKQHWTSLKRVMRYLKGTANHGIVYSKKGTKQCVGCCDADWAGDLDDRKSTSGYIFKMSEGAITWSSKKQPCVALSTAEAKYVALASAEQEAVWLRQLMSELGNTPIIPTTMFEDNQSAIAMTKNPQSHGRAKHRHQIPFYS
ncbi:uncharacterized protein [Dysidea avara]|uniref:uncharacterized protein n=1 Tax=Dysidea avara TaxID=196820 RepID=UPI003333DB10